MCDVLLVNAPGRTKAHEPLVVPPLGLAYLAAIARSAGHAVTILDAFAENLDWQEFAGRMAGGHYDLIGFFAMTPVFDTVQRAIRICRPHAKTLLLGGPHATAMKETVLSENPELDYLIFGEGEATFVEFLAGLDQGGVPPGMPGVMSREWSGPPRPAVADLDGLPFPARDLLPNHRYRYPLAMHGPITTMITSRGCPYDCIFCDKSVFGSRWRARSAENVLAEIDEVVARYGVRTIIFYDDLFTLKKERVAAICEGIIERGHRLHWKAEGRVDLADEEILRLMARAGCDTIAYGVESVNPSGLAYLNKYTSPDMVREAFRKTRAAGIRTMAYFILGIPVETYADALRSIDFAVEIQADYAQFSVLSPVPGSRLYEAVVANGWYREIPAQNVSDKDLLRPVVISGNWDEEQLVSIVREAHRRFYLRPGYMLRSLLRVRRFGDLARLVGLGMNVIKYALGSGR